MSTIYVAATALAGCNLHFTLYSAFGAVLLVRAALALRVHRYEAAREDGVLGFIHIALAML
jgi:hypothetical protein